MGEDEIVKEIVSDERSYSNNLLLDLGKTAYNKKLLDAHHFEKMQILIQKLTEAKLKEQDMKEILEDIPDKYLDMLTFDLMTDPIQLPGGDVNLHKNLIYN